MGVTSMTSRLGSVLLRFHDRCPSSRTVTDGADVYGTRVSIAAIESSPVSIQTQSLALATMICCLATQAIAFEWKSGLSY